MRLYRWAGSVALATFDDLGVLEVAMRSAIGRELARVYGYEWHRREDILDNDTLYLIMTAWRVGGLSQLNAGPEVVHGKLVATLMFGFWVKVLGRGGHQGKGPDRRRQIYDTTLWKPAIRDAFPNVGPLERKKVERAAHKVQLLRNRIAHHEHIVWGVPLAGTKNKSGEVERLPLSQAHETLLELAGYINTGLQEWIVANSSVKKLIEACPLPAGHDLLL